MLRERERESGSVVILSNFGLNLSAENCKSGAVLLLEGEKLNMHTKPRQSHYSGKLIWILLWNCLLGQKALRWLASGPAVTQKWVFNPLMEVSSILELWHFAKSIGLNLITQWLDYSCCRWYLRYLDLQILLKHTCLRVWRRKYVSDKTIFF